MNELDHQLEKILITEDEIKKKVQELADEIDTAFPPGEEIIMICILRGAVVFMADLARCLERQVTFDFMDVSSYGSGTVTSGVVRIIKDLEEDISGKNVLIVEDIIDTGLTLKYVVKVLKTRKPARLKVVTLLDKPERRVTEFKADFNGFAIPDMFVVGYGLDYAQKYRNLPYIAVLKASVYS